MKHETDSAELLRELQRLLDRSTATAGPAASTSVGTAGRQMSAEQLLAFWETAGVVAMTTVGRNGAPHSAPVHARIRGTHLSLVIYDNTLRRRDIEHNPKTSFVTWGRNGEAVILYGDATEVPDSLRPTRDSREGEKRNVVEIDVKLTRIYAMRGRNEG